MDKKTGYVIAGTGSGVGKTTIALGLMAWLQRLGYRIAPFKVGPDFIDPGHHTRITGTVSRNLDGWMLSREYNQKIYDHHSTNTDIAIVEGVMGLYDGYSGNSEAGSTAQMAKWLDLPVILVVNAQSMARSVAALIKGFVEFDSDVEFAGVFFNNLGSAHHLKYLKDAVAAYLTIPVLGGIIRDDRLTVPERHLGLVTDDEHRLEQADIDHLAELMDKGINREQLLKGARPNAFPESKKPEKRLKDSSLRIGVARDAAFCFYYQDNLDLLTSLGATLVFFSPIIDKHLPENLSGIYLGGGYPEVFARQLSENTALRSEVKKASRSGMPVYGECGGFMYLCDQLIGETGRVFPMSGCFPFVSRLLTRLKALGYREVSLKEDTISGKKGMIARGHEYHYSEIIQTGHNINQVYTIAAGKGDADRQEGFIINNTLGSYVHLHWGSNPEFGKHFVESCRKYMSGVTSDTP